MAVGRDVIKDWASDGIAKGATHMIVFCDTYDYEDYPVYVQPGERARVVAANKSGNMQKVMEVYDLRTDLAPQLAQKRSFNWNEPEITETDLAIERLRKAGYTVTPPSA